MFVKLYIPNQKENHFTIAYFIKNLIIIRDSVVAHSEDGHILYLHFDSQIKGIILIKALMETFEVMDFDVKITYLDENPTFFSQN